MGIIRASINAIGGGLADSWLEVIEADSMTHQTALAPGVAVRKNDRRNSNTKGTDYTISNGSVIHVDEGQFMMLVDGGKIVDYTAEPGYFKVDHSALPSLLNGQIGDALKESFNRIRYAGATPLKQKVFFINLQEIRDIKFGTPNPVNYFDNFYNAELFLRSYGTYSIRITDPIKFYIQVADKTNTSRIEINTVNEQYRNEFLTAFQSSINQMSADGIRISHVTSKSMQLAEYMQDILDDKWHDLRGFKIESVGIGSISYTDKSQELINMRNKGSMLGDPNVREGYVQGSIARGLEAAGSNEAGSAQTFMGMGIGMNAMGQGMGQFSETNRQQIQQNQEARAQKDRWFCPECGHENNGKFCSECGTKREVSGKECPNCNASISNSQAKFCPECGTNLREQKDN